MYEIRTQIQHFPLTLEMLTLCITLEVRERSVGAIVHVYAFFELCCICACKVKAEWRNVRTCSSFIV